jgi:hypothetical protein
MRTPGLLESELLGYGTAAHFVGGAPQSNVPAALPSLFTPSVLPSSVMRQMPPVTVCVFGFWIVAVAGAAASDATATAMSA